MKVKRKQNKGFRYLAPRFMAIVFVGIMYFIFLDDFLKLLNNFPVLYHFFVGTITLSLTLFLWGKNSKIAGTIFIMAGLLFPLLLWHQILFANIFMISIWLILIGILFFLDPGDPKKNGNLRYSK